MSFVFDNTITSLPMTDVSRAKMLPLIPAAWKTLVRQNATDLSEAIFGEDNPDGDK